MTRLRGIPLDTCEACGSIAFDGRRCSECGSLSEAYLHDRVRAAIKRERFEWIERDDGSARVAA